MVFTISNDYGYVLATLSASCIVNLWHGIQTARRRKASKVTYPNAYATAEEAAADDDKFAFNCAQRAHQNYIENWPTFIVTSLVSGLIHPKWTAAAGVVFLLGRVTYGIGYMNSPRGGTGQGRYKGAWYNIPQLALLGGSFYTSYKLVASA